MEVKNYRYWQIQMMSSSDVEKFKYWVGEKVEKYGCCVRRLLKSTNFWKIRMLSSIHVEKFKYSVDKIVRNTNFEFNGYLKKFKCWVRRTLKKKSVWKFEIFKIRKLSSRHVKKLKYWVEWILENANVEFAVC